MDAEKQSSASGQRLHVHFVDHGKDRFWRAKKKTGWQSVGIAVARNRNGTVAFTADWFHLSRNLAPEAAKKIELRWSSQSIKRARHLGGLRTCLGMDVDQDREKAWRIFLSDVLGDAKSYVSLNDEMEARGWVTSAKFFRESDERRRRAHESRRLPTSSEHKSSPGDGGS